jgi:hypothetical protein
MDADKMTKELAVGGRQRLNCHWFQPRTPALQFVLNQQTSTPSYFTRSDR